MRGTFSRRVLPYASLAAFAVTVWRASRYAALDDAYISFRYAWNLVHGRGLVFNPGEVVEGYSNFLWTMLSAAALALGIDPVAASRAAGLALTLAAAALVVAALRERSRALAACAGVAVCLAPPIVRQATNGLETALFTFLVTLGLVLGAKGRTRGASLVLALAALTRLEGALVFGVWWLALAWRARGEGRTAWSRLAQAAVLFSAVFASYFAWRWVHFGSLLPNTFYAKTAPLAMELRSGGAYVGTFLLLYPVFLLPLVPRRGPLDPRGAVYVLYLLYLVLIGGDSSEAFRFVAPLVPLGLVLAAERIAALSRGWRIAGGGALVVLMAVALGGTRVPADDAAALAARVVGEVARPGQSVATAMIGEIGYRNPEVVIVDTVGLVEPAIAREAADPAIRVKGHRKHDAALVLARDPDYFFPIGKLDVQDASHFTFTGFPFDTAIIERPDFPRRYALRGVEIGGRRIYYFARTAPPR